MKQKAALTWQTGTNGVVENSNHVLDECHMELIRSSANVVIRIRCSFVYSFGHGDKFRSRYQCGGGSVGNAFSAFRVKEGARVLLQGLLKVVLHVRSDVVTQGGHELGIGLVMKTRPGL